MLNITEDSNLLQQIENGFKKISSIESNTDSNPDDLTELQLEYFQIAKLLLKYNYDQAIQCFEKSYELLKKNIIRADNRILFEIYHHLSNHYFNIANIKQDPENINKSLEILFAQETIFSITNKKNNFFLISNFDHFNDIYHKISILSEILAGFDDALKFATESKEKIDIIKKDFDNKCLNSNLVNKILELAKIDILNGNDENVEIFYKNIKTKITNDHDSNVDDDLIYFKNFKIASCAICIANTYYDKDDSRNAYKFYKDSNDILISLYEKGFPCKNNLIINFYKLAECCINTQKYSDLLEIVKYLKSLNEHDSRVDEIIKIYHQNVFQIEAQDANLSTEIPSLTTQGILGDLDYSVHISADLVVNNSLVSIDDEIPQPIPDLLSSISGSESQINTSLKNPPKNCCTIS